MLERLLDKLRHWDKALAGIDDPQGEYLLRLEDRVLRVEQEVDSFRKRLSVETVAKIQSAEADERGIATPQPAHIQEADESLRTRGERGRAQRF